jgi:methyl-accepting chemotaxis protein
LTKRPSPATKIGNIHARVGLEPDLYISGYALVLETIIEDSLKGFSLPWQKRSRAKAVATLVKTALFDMEAALSAYFDAEAAQRNDIIAAMSKAMGEVAGGNLRAQLGEVPPATNNWPPISTICAIRSAIWSSR